MCAAIRRKRSREAAFLFFILRSVLCIGVVYLLVSPGGEEAAARRPAAIGAQPQATTGTKLGAATLALSRVGGDALGAALRDYCLASPRDCLELLRRQTSAAPH